MPRATDIPRPAAFGTDAAFRPGAVDEFRPAHPIGTARRPGAGDSGQAGGAVPAAPAARLPVRRRIGSGRIRPLFARRRRRADAASGLSHECAGGRSTVVWRRRTAALGSGYTATASSPRAGHRARCWRRAGGIGRRPGNGIGRRPGNGIGRHAGNGIGRRAGSDHGPAALVGRRAAGALCRYGAAGSAGAEEHPAALIGPAHGGDEIGDQGGILDTAPRLDA